MAHCGRLARLPLSSLDTLDLRLSRLQPAGIQRLVAADWPRFRRFEATCYRFEPASDFRRVIELLASHVATFNPRSLHELDDGSIIALCQSGLLNNVESLSLELSRITRLGVRAFVQCREVRGLDTFSFGASRYENGLLTELANAPHTMLWQSLSFCDVFQMTDSDVVEFARSPQFPHLRELHLTGHLLTEYAAFALANSTHFPKLRAIRFDAPTGEAMGTAGLMALRARYGSVALNEPLPSQR